MAELTTPAQQKQFGHEVALCGITRLSAWLPNGPCHFHLLPVAWHRRLALATEETTQHTDAYSKRRLEPLAPDMINFYETTSGTNCLRFGALLQGIYLQVLECYRMWNLLWFVALLQGTKKKEARTKTCLSIKS
jgi:hypothetical protein